MKMFKCSKCGVEWPENYCPTCAQTIERPAAQPAPTARSSWASAKLSETEANALSGKPTAKAGGMDCPICGSTGTGKAEGVHKSEQPGFRVFANRRCYVCDAVWQPACPKWAGLAAIVAGGAISYLAFIMYTGFTRCGMIAFLGCLPIAYGVAVLIGMEGKTVILLERRSQTKQRDSALIDYDQIGKDGRP